MKNSMLQIIFFIFLSLNFALGAAEIQLKDLKYFADGLNIEGGTIPQKYLQKDQIWANLCVILDRPFEDGVEWQELTNSNTFPLKEASLLDYNEAQVNYTYATLLHYYMSHAHQIAKKSSEQKAKILVQVHRNTSGPAQVELLKQLVLSCYTDSRGVNNAKSFTSRHMLFSYFFSSINVEIDFCYGTAPENLGELNIYKDYDILLSFSLVAGLHPKWKSGELIYSNLYIPFSLKELTYSTKRGYSIRNHLKEILPDLVNNQREEILSIINQYFGSLNSLKSHMKAKKLVLEDFKEATLLQVDGLFNPSLLHSNFSVEE